MPYHDRIESYVEGIPKLTIKNDENMRATQDKTSGFSNKVLESSMIPNKAETSVDDLMFIDGSWIYSIKTREA